MPAKNYYLVLGISRDETPSGIHAAYLDLTRELRAQPAETGRIREIDHAFEVLSDPIRRRVHDELMDFEPPTPEPLAPQPQSLLAFPEQTHPSYEAFRDRYLRNFTHRHVPKAERAESLTLEVALSPREAALGCSISVGAPVFETCLECRGTGHAWPFRCAACAGSGFVEETRTLEIVVPPGVRPGAVIEAPLDLFGVANLYLRVCISVIDLPLATAA